MISFIKKAINLVYHARQKLGGVNPWFSLFSHQYLATLPHNQWLQRVCPYFTGTVLDFGCGRQPYKRLMPSVEYVGIDLPTCETADIFVVDGWKIPESNNRFDGLISTQAIEHVPDLDKVVAEWRRVLKQGGQVVVTVPFLFHLHGEPFDFRRFTEYGLTKYFSDQGFVVRECERFGGIGSYLIVGLLDAFESQPGRLWFLIRIALLPFSLIYVPLLNLVGLGLNKLDKTHAFYLSLGVTMVKK